MDWPNPTFASLVATVKAYWASLRPGADSTPYGDAWVYQHTLGHIQKGLWEMLSRGVNRLFPTTTKGNYLDRWLNFIGRPDGLGGYGLIKAHVSSGSDVLAVTFTGVGTINPTHELLDDALRRYRINETYTSGGAEVYNADLISIDTGLGVNLEAGETLLFSNPPGNVETQTTLVGDLDFGRALEDDDSGGAALVQKMQQPSLSGNWCQWQQWIEEASPGNFDGWAWPKRNNGPYGHGSTDYLATDRSELASARLTSAAQNAVLDAYIEDEAGAPLLALKGYRRLTPTEVKKVVSYTFKLSESIADANRCDWDANSAKRTITGIDKPNKTITVDVAYTTIYPTSGQKCLIAGQEVTVTNGPGAGGNGMDEITFSSWPAYWDTITLTNRHDGTGFAVCSGGGIMKSTHDAISAYVNNINGTPPDGRGDLPKLGPAKGPYASKITGWDDTLRVDNIKSAAVIAAQGKILSHTQCLIAGAAADAGPTYDTTANVQIMICPEIAPYEDKT